MVNEYNTLILEFRFYYSLCTRVLEKAEMIR